MYLTVLNADLTWTSYDILSKPKFGQTGPKIKISSDLPETLFMSQYLRVVITKLTSIF